MIEPGALADELADLRSRIAFNLRRLRLEQGLTQEQVGARVGIHRNVVQRVESDANIKLDRVLKVAVALDASLEDLGYCPERAA